MHRIRVWIRSACLCLLGLLLFVLQAQAATDAWSQVSSPLTSKGAKANVSKLVNDPASPAIRYAIGGDGIFKSTDDGATWAAVNSGIVATPAGYIGVDDLVVDPKNHTTLYAAGWAAMQKSSNGGASWTVIGQPGNWHISALAIDPVNTSNLYGATNGGMYKSTDGGANWVNMGGSSAIEYSVSIDPLNPTTLYVTNSSGAWKWSVAAAGDTSVKINNGIYNNPTYGYQVTMIAPDPRHAGIVYAATGSGMYKSVDGGSNWQASNTCYKDSQGNSVSLLSASAIAFDPSDSSIIYISGNRGLYKTSDAAAHWTLATVNAFGSGQLVVDPNAPMTIFGAYGFGGVIGYTYSTSSLSSDSDRIFNWAEATYAAYFKPSSASQNALGYYYRYYSLSNSYLATQNGRLYLYGPAFGPNLIDLGVTSLWLSQAQAAGF